MKSEKKEEDGYVELRRVLTEELMPGMKSLPDFGSHPADKPVMEFYQKMVDDADFARTAWAAVTSLESWIIRTSAIHTVQDMLDEKLLADIPVTGKAN